MKLILGPESLQTEFEFVIWKRAGSLTFVNGSMKKVNRIGLYLSGGLDSAALLCMILTELQSINKLDTPITCFTINKTDCFNKYSKDVLCEVQKHFNINHIEHVIINNDQVTNEWLNPRNEIGPNVIKYVASYHKHMAVYMACNRMAPENYIKYTTPMLTNHGHRINSDHYCLPFLFLHKPQMLDVFFKLGVEHIIPYCHSCVIQEVGQCGKCYSCEERAWGFEMMNISDPLNI